MRLARRPNSIKVRLSRFLMSLPRYNLLLTSASFLQDYALITRLRAWFNLPLSPPNLRQLDITCSGFSETVRGLAQSEPLQILSILCVIALLIFRRDQYGSCGHFRNNSSFAVISCTTLSYSLFKSLQWHRADSSYFSGKSNASHSLGSQKKKNHFRSLSVIGRYGAHPLSGLQCSRPEKISVYHDGFRHTCHKQLVDIFGSSNITFCVFRAHGSGE